MKLLLALSLLLASALTRGENCGIKNSNSSNLPWSVSLFYNTSNLVLCQGTIISDRHVLTAGHCMQHKQPSSVLVYSGLYFYRPHSDDYAHGMPWQLEQINLHPDMKLTSHGTFINGGFVASMEIHADIAIATLKRAIQFTDTISSVCLQTSEIVEFNGSFAGWNSESKRAESFNASINLKTDEETFKILQERRSIKFIDGTGIYAQSDSSWKVVGVMTMIGFNPNGTESIQFTNLHMFANWTTNFLQNSSTLIDREASSRLAVMNLTESAAKILSPSHANDAIERSFSSTKETPTAAPATSNVESNDSTTSAQTTPPVSIANDSRPSTVTPTTRKNSKSLQISAKSSTEAPGTTTTVYRTPSPTPNAASTVEKVENVTTTSEKIASPMHTVTSTPNTSIDSNSITKSAHTDTRVDNLIENGTSSAKQFESEKIDVRSGEKLTEIVTSTSSGGFTATTAANSSVSETSTTKAVTAETTKAMPSKSEASTASGITKAFPSAFTTKGTASAEFATSAHASESSLLKAAAGTAIPPSTSSFLSQSASTESTTQTQVSLADEVTSKRKISVQARLNSTTTAGGGAMTSSTPQPTIGSATKSDEIDTISNIVDVIESTTQSTSPTARASSERNKVEATVLKPLLRAPSDNVSSLGTSSEPVKIDNFSRTAEGRSLNLFNATLNATAENSTLSEESQPLTAQFGLNAFALISIVFAGALLMLLVIFGILGRQEPTAAAH